MNIRLIKAKAAEQVLWFVNGQPGLFYSDLLSFISGIHTTSRIMC